MMPPLCEPRIFGCPTAVVLQDGLLNAMIELADERRDLAVRLSGCLPSLFFRHPDLAIGNRKSLSTIYK